MPVTTSCLLWIGRGASFVRIVLERLNSGLSLMGDGVDVGMLADLPEPSRQRGLIADRIKRLSPESRELVVGLLEDLRYPNMQTARILSDAGFSISSDSVQTWRRNNVGDST